MAMTQASIKRRKSFLRRSAYNCESCLRQLQAALNNFEQFQVLTTIGGNALETAWEHYKYLSCPTALCTSGFVHWAMLEASYIAENPTLEMWFVIALMPYVWVADGLTLPE
eukprot:12780404-Alexandrium_andersonii.AAC.1